MKSQKPLSGRQVVVLCVLSLLGGGIGTVIGQAFGGSLRTTAAWIGPAIVVSAMALLLVGVLLLPAAIRAFRAAKCGAPK
jgi:hypothetical protein